MLQTQHSNMRFSFARIIPDNILCFYFSFSYLMLMMICPCQIYSVAKTIFETFRDLYLVDKGP